MLLAIDIGNTNIALGVFHGNKKKKNFNYSLLTSWRLTTLLSATMDEYGIKILELMRHTEIKKREIEAIAIASVVPTLTSVFKEGSKKYFKLTPWIIGENLKIGMTNLYEDPKEVGADRIVNAMVSYSKFGAPLIVVDFGTATTFDCVSKKGDYLGGIIVPGPILSAESLYLHTAKLPRVELAKSNHLIGKNTVESIQSGLYFGYLSLVDGIVERLRAELGEECRVVATGGLAFLMAEDSKYIKRELVFPDLTLEGVCLAWEKSVQ